MIHYKNTVGLNNMIQNNTLVGLKNMIQCKNIVGLNNYTIQEHSKIEQYCTV